MRALQICPAARGIKAARRAVDDEFARFIQFLQHIQGAIAARGRVALHQTVDVRCGQA